MIEKAMRNHTCRPHIQRDPRTWHGTRPRHWLIIPITWLLKLSEIILSTLISRALASLKPSWCTYSPMSLLTWRTLKPISFRFNPFIQSFHTRGMKDIHLWTCIPKGFIIMPKLFSLNVPEESVFNVMEAGWFCEKSGWIGKVEDVEPVFKKMDFHRQPFWGGGHLPGWIVK